MGILCLVAVFLWGQLAAPAPVWLQTLAQDPDQVFIQARHSLKDDQNMTWQVICFARREQVELRLVGFPDRYHFQPDQPLLLQPSPGESWRAAADFPKADSVPNVGQFDLSPLVERLPTGQPLTLTLPLVEGQRRILIPAPVTLEWHEVIRQARRLAAGD